MRRSRNTQAAIPERFIRDASAIVILGNKNLGELL